MSTSNSNQLPLVLIADVEPLSRALAETTLLSAGYRVLTVRNGDDALYAFNTHAPHCVLLDLRLPPVDGLAVCRRIRALPQGETTPVIFMTALRNTESFDAAREAGGDDFMLKPVHPPDLVSRVASALAKRAGTLAEYARWLEQQRDQLIRLQLQKERLAAFIVHDMKNPLHAVALQAQLLLHQSDISDRVRASLERIRFEARQLERQVLELLDVAQSNETGLRIDHTEITTEQLVHDVFAELQIVAAERGIELRIGPWIDPVRGDRALIRRVLANLIENALRHAPSDTSVIVNASQIGTEFELSVADSGAGIPPELRERIFDAYFRAGAPDDSTRTDGGRGLGLAFCREVARAHGGTIRVEDASPGALFRMRWIVRGGEER